MLIIYQPDGIFAFFVRFNHHIYAGFMRSYLNFNQWDIKQKLVTDIYPVPVACALECGGCSLHPTSLFYLFGVFMFVVCLSWFSIILFLSMDEKWQSPPRPTFLITDCSSKVMEMFEAIKSLRHFKWDTLKDIAKNSPETIKLSSHRSWS